MREKVSIRWNTSPRDGSVSIKHGTLACLIIAKGTGQVSGEDFQLKTSTDRRLDIYIDDANLSLSANPTVVKVKSRLGSFSFLLRDIDPENPIFIPAFHVAVTRSDDTGSCRR